MLRAGDVLADRYRLCERVGGGGMGDVWRSEDTVLGRTVAVKVLLARLADAANFRERFRREARSIAALEAPSIAEVYDFGEESTVDGILSYLVMQFVDGMSLSRRLAGWGRLNAADTLSIVAQVADALEVAHGSGIIHRDVKPGNILVRDSGQVVLVDFGIARTETNLTMTTTGVVLGTVTYMSPEQASGQRLGPASDIYSLGVVTHQCLAGHPPFKADTPLGVLSAHLGSRPPALPADISEPIRGLVTRALAKEPDERWPSAGAFAEACRRAADERVAAVETPRPEAIPSPEPEHAAVTVGTAPDAAAPVPAMRRPVPLDASGSGDRAVPRPAPVPPSLPPRQRRRPETEEPEPEPRPKRRRGLFLSLCVVALILAVGAAATAATRPWQHTTYGIDTSEKTDGLQAQPGANHHGAAGDAKGDGSGSSHGASRSASKSKETSGDRTSSASSSSSSSPDSVAVPNVVNETETDARRDLTNAGLRPAVIYEGEGNVSCGVTGQDPAAGTRAKPDSSVTITVRKAKDRCPQ